VRKYLGGDKIIPFGQGAQLPNRDRDGKRGDVTELLAELQKLGLLCSCDGDLHGDIVGEIERVCVGNM
jgi:hypothetical protein